MRTNSVKSFFFYWLPVLLYAGVIFIFSSLSADAAPEWFPGQEIVFHVIEYAGFAFLICRLLKQHYPSAGRAGVLVLSFLIILVYALTDEYHQSFVPGRAATILDVAMDCLGAVLAGAFYR